MMHGLLSKIVYPGGIDSRWRCHQLHSIKATKVLELEMYYMGDPDNISIPAARASQNEEEVMDKR